MFYENSMVEITIGLTGPEYKMIKEVFPSLINYLNPLTQL